MRHHAIVKLLLNESRISRERPYSFAGHTSMGDPRLPAKGRVMRLGTKKTGNHFAKRPAPGLRCKKTLGPNPPLFLVKRSMLAKRAQHPPNEDGKEIDRARKSRRTPTSIAIKIEAERNGVAALIAEAGIFLASFSDEELTLAEPFTTSDGVGEVSPPVAVEERLVVEKNRTLDGQSFDSCAVVVVGLAWKIVFEVGMTKAPTVAKKEKLIHMTARR